MTLSRQYIQLFIHKIFRYYSQGFFISGVKPVIFNLKFAVSDQRSINKRHKIRR